MISISYIDKKNSLNHHKTLQNAQSLSKKLSLPSSSAKVAEEVRAFADGKRKTKHIFMVV